MSEFSFNVGVEFFPADCFRVVSSYCMDDLQKLKLSVAVFQLVIDELQVLELQLSLAFVVNQVEGCVSTFFIEWIALNKSLITILLVSSLTNPSKSRAWPSFASWISVRSLRAIPNL